MIQQDKLLREVVKNILTNATKYDGWTLQGFGMLRLYMPDKMIRLSVWDKSYRIDNVSLIHTHPWHFESYVVCGEIFNWKYQEGIFHPQARPYIRQPIHAGEGGGLVGAPQNVMLIRSYQPELVAPGRFYKQKAEEIHHTDYTDGTVTICDRMLASNDPHRAVVYWPSDKVWVSAEPQKVAKDIINDITRKALELL